MDNYIICLSGKIGSGKTTLANGLAKRLEIPLLSTGDFIKSECKSRGSSLIYRENLQTVGMEYINTGWDSFVNEFLKHYNWIKSSSYLIEGIRHVEFYNAIKRFTDPTKTYLVYIDLDEKERQDRIHKRPNVYLDENNESHFTEINYETIKEKCDVYLKYTNKSEKEAVDEIIHELKVCL